MQHNHGLIIAAPSSGSGKTTLTLALLRHLRNRGVAVASAKIGPDYIDPGFHQAASSRTCYNLDSWAMRRETLADLVGRCAQNSDIVIVEGVMGLFDGAGDGSGSSAEMARMTGWPVILVVDAQGMAASAAAVVHGFNSFSPDVSISGVIFNRIGSPVHAQILNAACESLAIPVLGCLPRNNDIVLPDRHLGLVQAAEHPQLEDFFERAADWVASHLDIPQLLALAKPAQLTPETPSLASIPTGLPVLGQRIAIASDQAFSFCYPFVVDAWRAAGVEILPFSPLADEAPASHADAVYLPGGYPELYPGKLAANRNFLEGLRAAARHNAVIYGECGGFMVLGQELIDSEGEHHKMAGLLSTTTSFAQRRLHLGYRQLVVNHDTPLGRAGSIWRGHEFHFASLVDHSIDHSVSNNKVHRSLFDASDARGQSLGAIGECNGNVMGSFAHLIDRTPAL